MGSTEVTYRTVDSPIGELLLATTDVGLVRVAFDSEGFDEVLQELSEKVGPLVLRASESLDVAAAEVAEYFARSRTSFDLPLDLRLISGFRREVVAHLMQIPYGKTESYAEVATAVGSPQAVRAVGGACAHNPLPLVVPCHRVVRTDGKPGGYLGGADVKDYLLAFESA